MRVHRMLMTEAWIRAVPQSLIYLNSVHQGKKKRVGGGKGKEEKRNYQTEMLLPTLR